MKIVLESVSVLLSNACMNKTPMIDETAVTSQNRVNAFELLDHGVEHAQYFQGCGVAFTKFDNVATGCGDNFSEALNDALEQIAMSEDKINVEDLEAQINEEYGFKSSKDWPTLPSADEVFRKANDMTEDEENDSELYYYVSIRYNVEG
jgi:hypothetical protein